MAIKVSKEIESQIMKIRDSGKTNMFATNEVQVIANEMGFYQLVIWIEDNRTEYAKGILHGFEIEETNETSSQEQQE